MKLQQLAIGDRFEYDGRILVKTGPLTASSDDGGQQMIPRYAVLKPLDLPGRVEHLRDLLAAQGLRADAFAEALRGLAHATRTIITNGGAGSRGTGMTIVDRQRFRPVATGRGCGRGSQSAQAQSMIGSHCSMSFSTRDPGKSNNVIPLAATWT